MIGAISLLGLTATEAAAPPSSLPQKVAPHRKEGKRTKGEILRLPLHRRKKRRKTSKTASKKSPPLATLSHQPFFGAEIIKKSSWVGFFAFFRFSWNLIWSSPRTRVCICFCLTHPQQKLRRTWRRDGPDLTDESGSSSSFRYAAVRFHYTSTDVL